MFFRNRPATRKQSSKLNEMQASILKLREMKNTILGKKKDNSVKIKLESLNTLKKIETIISSRKIDTNENKSRLQQQYYLLKTLKGAYKSGSKRDYKTALLSLCTCNFAQNMKTQLMSSKVIQPLAISSKSHKSNCRLRTLLQISKPDKPKKQSKMFLNITTQNFMSL